LTSFSISFRDSKKYTSFLERTYLAYAFILLTQGPYFIKIL